MFIYKSYKQSNWMEYIITQCVAIPHVVWHCTDKLKSGFTFICYRKISFF